MIENSSAFKSSDFQSITNHLTMSIEPDDDPSLHRLEGSRGNEKGGLIIKKKSNVDKSHEFTKPQLSPRTSLLGLDKLAAAKRMVDEPSVELSRKKSRIISYQDEDDDDDDDGDSDSDEEENNERSKKDKHKLQTRYNSRRYPLPPNPYTSHADKVINLIVRCM